MFGDMSDGDFVEFLAALWESRGWSTGIREQASGVFMITGDRQDGTRGLLLVVPDPNATVGGQLLQKATRIIQEKGVEVGVAATRGTFSDEAERVAKANDIHLLDQQTLEETVAKENAYDLLDEFSGRRGSLSDRLPAISPANLEIPAGGIQVVVVVFAVLAVIVGGLHYAGMGGILDSLVGTYLEPILSILPLPTLPALPFPDVGLALGGGGYPVTAVSLNDGNATPVHVRWDARRQKSLVTPDGQPYTAGNETNDNVTFVVVQLNVTNPRSEAVVLRPSYFALSANNTRYGNQVLKGSAGQLPMQIPENGSDRAYVVYTVPDDTDSATVLGLPGEDVPPMRFERDRDLEFQVERG